MFMDPPRTYAELCIWKVYVETTKDEVWQRIAIWLKRHGNPFEDVTFTTYEAHEERGIYCLALTYVMKRHT